VTDISFRLTRCFSLVFPGASPAQILSASTVALPNWDSIASITLINVIEEEFHIVIDLEVIPELNSYQAMESYLRKVTGGD